MRIAGRDIGSGRRPYIVAEASGEHCGDLDKAHKLISAAKKAGADAIKFQCFDPDRLAEARGGKDKGLTEGLWAGRTLGDLYRETRTPRRWFPELFDHAAEIGITAFASVFHEDDVDFLELLNCPAYKIASPEITCLPLIRKAASTGKPHILSTGMADYEELWDAYYAMASLAHAHDCAWLHCVSSYPCDLRDANLVRMRELQDMRLGGEVGLSDHTLGSTVPIVATALGASIIEKHITLSRENGGPDKAFSLEPHEFARMVQDVRDAYAALGTGERPQSEEIYRSLRRKG